MNNDFEQTDAIRLEPNVVANEIDSSNESKFTNDLGDNPVQVKEEPDRQGAKTNIKNASSIIFGIVAISVLIISLFLLVNAISETGGAAEVPRDWAPGSLTYLDDNQAPVDSFDLLEGSRVGDTSP
jgi:hypothetical protein